MERRLAAILAVDMAGYTRLMEADETGVIERQKFHRHEWIDPQITRLQGRVIKSTGDGLLAEFASAADAVEASVAIQTGMALREEALPEDRKIRYRFGINVGDVVFDGGDIFGSGVNVAARLESLAEPGGICLSDAAYQIVRDNSGETFRDLGTHMLKNVSRAIRVWQWVPDAAASDSGAVEHAEHQRIRFCRAEDGVQLAYARVGAGPALLKAPNFLNHLDYEWRTPVWGPVFAGLSKAHELVRFDQRGGGLSDWAADDLSFEKMVSDIGSVADAAQLDRFTLFGISQGCAFSVGYAARHPDRVRALILLGGYTRGVLERGEPDAQELFEANQTLILRGWGAGDPVYRNMFTANLIPDATPQQKAGLDELQRVSVSPETTARILEENARIDVQDLAGEITVPALVMHCEGDQVVPAEEGRRMAALIPGARFVSLPGSNHALVEGTPAFDSFFREVTAFLGDIAG